MSDVLVIIASSRRESDTKKYVEFVFEGKEVKVIDLLDYQIAPYDYSGKYPATDNFFGIADIMSSHNVIVFSTPVYWYAMSGIMKTFFDRFTDLVTIRKPAGRQWKSKSILLLAVGSDPEIPQGFDVPFILTAEYFDMQYKGSIYFSNKTVLTDQRKNEMKRDFLEIIKSVS